MSLLEDKISSITTRPAEIFGTKVQVKIYSASEWLKITKRMEKMTEKQLAEFISQQVLDENGNPAVSAEFMRSDKFKQCLGVELINLIRDVNNGAYQLKNSLALVMGN